MDDEKKVTVTDVLTVTVAAVLAPLVRRAVYPETTYKEENWGAKKGADLTRFDLARKDKFGMPPLLPRERLSTRLAFIVALKEAELQLLRDIKADTEAIEDAKAHGQKVNHELSELPADGRTDTSGE